MSERRELLVLKVGADYIRLEGGAYLPCALQRASVFALGEIEALRGHREALRRAGHPGARLCRLTIDEQVLECD